MMQEKFSQLDAIDAAKIVARHRTGWDQAGIVAAFAKVRYDLDVAQALTAALKAATDPIARTPAAIAWEKYRPVETTTGAFPGKPCPDHPDFWAANCRCCWSEVRCRPQLRPAAYIGRHYEPEAVTHEAASSMKE